LIVLIAAAVAVLAVVLFGAKKGRDKRQAGKRMEAQEIRQGAEIESAKARQARGEAEEAMARAERQERFARERHADADDVDPDADSRSRKERQEFLEHGRG
jgi:hypothetical protein